VNLCSRNSPYSQNCHVDAMLVFRMLCRITQSSDAHRTESVSVMDHAETMGVSSRVLDQKQQNIFGRISLFWSVELQGQPEHLNGGDHNWLVRIKCFHLTISVFRVYTLFNTCGDGSANCQ